MLVLLGQLEPLVQLLLELTVANLLDDVGVSGLIDRECFPAVRAVDFMHSWNPNQTMSAPNGRTCVPLWSLRGEKNCRDTPVSGLAAYEPTAGTNSSVRGLCLYGAAPSCP